MSAVRSPRKVETLHVKLPTSAEVTSDPLTLWLERHRATLTIRVSLGRTRATLEGAVQLSYSDEEGSKSKHWEISRSADTVSEAVAAAVAAACKYHVVERG